MCAPVAFFAGRREHSARPSICSPICRPNTRYLLVIPHAASPTAMNRRLRGIGWGCETESVGSYVVHVQLGLIGPVHRAGGHPEWADTKHDNSGHVYRVNPSPLACMLR